MKPSAAEVGVARRLASVLRQAAARSLGISAVVLLSGCAVGEPTSEPEASSTDEVISADGILVCPVEGISPDPWISVTAINNKLRHYPEFAKAIGLTQIKTCAEGLSFHDKYRKYQEEFPYFDRDEPYEDANVAETEPPPLSDEDLRAGEGVGPKIKNGSGDRLSPVVRLYRNDALTSYCTGTFIGRNWIITAAHCMQTKPGFKRGTDSATAAQIAGWYPYNVEYYGPEGKLLRVARYVNVRQYMDPRYTGFVPNNPYHAHDFALLYIDKQHDGGLPNMDPSLNSSTFPFMRVSMADHIVDIAAATFWGAGLIDNSTLTTGPDGQPMPVPAEAGPADPRLRKGSLLPYQTSFNLKPEPEKALPFQKPDGSWGIASAPRSINGKLFYVNDPSGSAAYTCHGDSGGPLVEPWIVKDLNGNPVTAYVQAGVLSEHVFDLQTPCATDADCVGVSQYAFCNVGLHECEDYLRKCQDAPAQGLGQGWVATTFEREFIEATIKKWYKYNFRCTTAARVDASTGTQTADQFLQCWGKPCKHSTCTDESDPDCCASNEYCYRPGSELTSCIECPGGGCGCYYGQCLQVPPPKPAK